jgi:hypothetical protein
MEILRWKMCQGNVSGRMVLLSVLYRVVNGLWCSICGIVEVLLMAEDLIYCLGNSLSFVFKWG